MVSDIKELRCHQVGCLRQAPSPPAAIAASHRFENDGCDRSGGFHRQLLASFMRDSGVRPTLVPVLPVHRISEEHRYASRAAAPSSDGQANPRSV